jgi:hypothetical protein
VFLECSSGADIWSLWKELSESMVKRREEFVTSFASTGVRKEKNRERQLAPLSFSGKMKSYRNRGGKRSLMLEKKLTYIYMSNDLPVDRNS